MDGPDVYLLCNTRLFQTIFIENIVSMQKDGVIAKAETIASCDTQPAARNLPNILRNSNTKAHKTHKSRVVSPRRIDASCTKEAKDVCFDTSMTFSNVVSKVKKSEYDKIPSPKSRHLRKQIHNPLNMQLDTPDWNNNKDKSELQAAANKMDIPSHVFSSRKERSRKKLKLNNNHHKDRCLFNKKLRKTRARMDRKIGVERSNESPVDSAADINMTDDVALKSVNNVLLTQSAPNLNVSTNYADDPSDNGCKSDDLSIFYCDAIRRRGAFQNEHSSCEFSMTENDSMDSMSLDIASNYLFAPEMLRTCTCQTCACIRDKDVISYEDTVPSCLNDEAETSLYAPYVYDFYTSDYYHILGDNWLEDLNRNVNLETAEEETVVTKDACVSDTKLNEKVANDAAAASTKSRKLAECNNKIADKEYSSLGRLSVEKNKVSSPNDACQIAVPTNVTDSEYAGRSCKNEKDIFLIQCRQCQKLFNKIQFRKHFTHCSFYKEDFKCHVCERIYRYKSSLVQHLKTVHHLSYVANEKYYVCDKCKKLYVRYRAFQRHVLFYHDCNIIASEYH